MPKCESCGGKAGQSAVYPDGTERFFCNISCQKKAASIGCHFGEGEGREECINAIVLDVIDHKTLLVQFIPYGSGPVRIELLPYDAERFEPEQRAKTLKEILNPVILDGEKKYTTIRVDVVDVHDNIPRTIVHVSHWCEFCEEHLKVHCVSPESAILNLNKFLVWVWVDHNVSEEDREELTEFADEHVGAPYRKPLNLHLKKGAFTRYAKAHHMMRKGATRIPERTIQKVMHSKTSSTHAKRMAVFAENARHWHHGGRHTK